MTELPFATLPVDPGVADRPPRELQPTVATYVSLIELGLITSARSLQRSLGPSQVGHPCDRRLVYLLDGTAPTNFGDPMKLLIGIGVHDALAEVFRRVDGGSGRFLVEEYASYRGCAGNFDLLDQFNHCLVDWKTTTKTRLAKYIKDGPPDQYQVQVQIYAAGLQTAGYQVDQIAVVFLPHDGALTQAWAWLATPDRSVADAAIDRVQALQGRDPREVVATPDRHCTYCDHYNPRTTDLSIACPGPKPGGKK